MTCLLACTACLNSRAGCALHNSWVLRKWDPLELGYSYHFPFKKKRQTERLFVSKHFRDKTDSIIFQSVYKNKKKV